MSAKITGRVFGILFGGCPPFCLKKNLITNVNFLRFKTQNIFFKEAKNNNEN